MLEFTVRKRYHVYHDELKPNSLDNITIAETEVVGSVYLVLYWEQFEVALANLDLDFFLLIERPPKVLKNDWTQNTVLEFSGFTVIFVWQLCDILSSH